MKLKTKRRRRVVDVTMARVFGVLVARLRYDGWTPDQIASWARVIAEQVGKPTDADVAVCRSCGQVVEGKA